MSSLHCNQYFVSNMVQTYRLYIRVAALLKSPLAVGNKPYGGNCQLRRKSVGKLMNIFPPIFWVGWGKATLYIFWDEIFDTTLPLVKE